MNIITELWNGNIKPINYFTKNNTEIQHLEKLLQANLNTIEQTFNDKEKNILQNYNDCIDEYISLICEEAFTNGFSLGVNMITEAFNKNDTAFIF